MIINRTLLLCLVVQSIEFVRAFHAERTIQSSLRRKVPFVLPYVKAPLHMVRPDGSEAEDDETVFHRSEEMEMDNVPILRPNITEAIDKKIRVSKAKSEIDRILKGPDAPFDTESELKKVISIAPQVEEDLVQEELEEKFSQLEQDLYQAVKQQDYAKAAITKKEISQMHVDDCGAVLQVNAAFYRAFSNKDFRTMESLWLKDGTSTCIHPSLRPLVGSKAVLNSWKRMFESSDGSFQRNWMEPSDIRIAVKGASTAIVTCDELVYARRFIRGQKRQTELINKLTATNIFRKVAGKWYITYHHASWHADSQAAKQALRGSAPFSGKGRAIMRSRSSLDGGDDENTSRGMDGILGMDNFGPLLGSSGTENGKKPVKRIVMGNLSDILNGSLGDILGGEGSSTDDDNSEGNAIISFSRIEDDDEDDEDNDVEIVDQDGDDEDEDTGSGAVSIIKQWTESTGSASKKSSSNSKSSSSDASSPSAPKDVLRQSCITALRKLADQGSISPKQKRVLLTDIITCSAKGEFSMVEVAYELLCGEGEDKEAAEEEFADQCRVFAHSLPDSPTGRLE